jgi:hypothetical protein
VEHIYLYEWLKGAVAPFAKMKVEGAVAPFAGVGLNLFM